MIESPARTAPATPPTPPPNLEPGADVILCADDFALTDGVTRGIEELALARRLSATSAIVTRDTWPAHAPRLRALRSFVAAGLHLNLTLGAPLGRAPSLAPAGAFESNVVLLRRCLTGRIPTDEIAGEIERQLETFEQAMGVPPDFIDGHQHVHTLPRVRHALRDVITRRYTTYRPLIRDPWDNPLRIVRRGAAAAKAVVIAELALGFGAMMRAAGFPTNHGFSGVSPFALDVPYSRELEQFFKARGRRHLVMCHPGYPDAVLADLDSVVARRRHEIDALFAAPGLERAIWHVEANSDRAPVDWAKALPA
jgi:predicted glycoside hydrolase/deacetylase ChbG (UPF0249 family)